MEWKKPSPELIELLGSKMGAFTATKKTMFGSPVYFANDQMFTGVHQDNIFIRLSENDRNEFLGKYKEAVTFEPMKGRKMKEYVVVPPSVYENDGVFFQWIKRSLNYTMALPPKQNKIKKK
jgi:TfoX/Sxy family transcriptional regulator of competence genes